MAMCSPLFSYPLHTYIHSHTAMLGHTTSGRYSAALGLSGLVVEVVSQDREHKADRQEAHKRGQTHMIRAYVLASSRFSSPVAHPYRHRACSCRPRYRKDCIEHGYGILKSVEDLRVSLKREKQASAHQLLHTKMSCQSWLQQIQHPC